MLFINHDTNISWLTFNGVINKIIGDPKPKWVNPNDIQYGVNSLKLGGLNYMFQGVSSLRHGYLHMKESEPKWVNPNDI